MPPKSAGDFRRPSTAADKPPSTSLPRRLGQDRPIDPLTRSGHMGSDGTIPAPDGSGRQVKVITVDDVVAYLKAHPTFFENHAELAEAMVAGAARPGTGRHRHAAGDPEAPALRDRPPEERAHRDHRQFQAEPDRPEPHPGGGHQHHPGDDLREDDPRRHPRAARAVGRRFHHRWPSRPMPTRPSACRCAASMCWRRAPSMPPSAPTSTPACAPASPARRPSSATSPAS